MADDQAVALTGNGVVDDFNTAGTEHPDLQGIAHGPAVVAFKHVRMIFEKGAIADDDRVLDASVAFGFYLVASIALESAAPYSNRCLLVKVQQVEAIRGVVMDKGVFEHPVAASCCVSHAVAKAPGLLRPAAENFTSRVALAATVPGDFELTENHVSTARTISAYIAVPADPAVGAQRQAFGGPVMQTPAVNAANGHAMDIDVAQQYVAGVTGLDAGAGPVAKGRPIALAGINLARAVAAVAMLLDAAVTISDLEASYFYLRTSLQVEHHLAPFGAPELGRVWATSVVTGTENPCFLSLRWTAGNCHHVTIPTPIGIATSRARGAQAHPVAASADIQSVTALDPSRTTGRQGHKRMIPGADPLNAAARIGCVALSGTL